MTVTSTDRPPAVWALFTASLLGGLALIGLFVWMLVAFGGLSKAALLAGGPGVALVAGAIGLYGGRRWTKGTLAAGFVLTAWCSLLLGIFFMLAADGFDVKVAIPAVAVAVSIGLMVLLRSTSVNQYLWAKSLGEEARSPDDELLDQVELDFGSEVLPDEAERPAEQKVEEKAKV